MTVLTSVTVLSQAFIKAVTAKSQHFWRAVAGCHGISGVPSKVGEPSHIFTGRTSSIF